MVNDGRFKKGNIPWNKEKKGYSLNISEERKKELREAMLGDKNPAKRKEVREKIRDSKLGTKRPDTTKRNLENNPMPHGEKNPAWKGGKSFEPYTIDFNKAFKESIRERDNHCCVICNKSQEELEETLCVHHVDYNKKNTFKQNAVSLCRKNHAETNNNRKSWTMFFQNLLKERYGYEYTFDQKIILDFDKMDGGD